MKSDTHERPRLVKSVCRFRAGPGREREAAEAWWFEMRYYFLRGPVEGSPQVDYADGVYTVTGQMFTTHPGDVGDVVEFDKNAPPWDLDFGTDSDRKEVLRKLYEERPDRWDGGMMTAASRVADTRQNTSDTGDL